MPKKDQVRLHNSFHIGNCIYLCLIWEKNQVRLGCTTKYPPNQLGFPARFLYFINTILMVLLICLSCDPWPMAKPCGRKWRFISPNYSFPSLYVQCSICWHHATLLGLLYSRSPNFRLSTRPWYPIDSITFLMVSGLHAYCNSIPIAFQLRHQVLALCLTKTSRHHFSALLKIVGNQIGGSWMKFNFLLLANRSFFFC